MLYELTTEMNVVAELRSCQGCIAKPTTATMKGPRRSLTHLGKMLCRSMDPVMAFPAVWRF